MSIQKIWNEERGQVFIKRLKKITGEETQEGIATKIDTSAKTVSEWANGKRTPDLEKILYICTTFNCSADDLLGLNEIYTKELSLLDVYKRIMEIDRVFDLHIEVSGLLETKEAYHKSKVSMFIAPKARNDHKTETLINCLNEYRSICDLPISDKRKAKMIYDTYSELNYDDMSKREAEDIVKGITRNIMPGS